jgi:ketosteroid isomerase-like protein
MHREFEMQNTPRDPSVNPSDKTILTDPERATRSPRFDEKSIQRARHAVPLGRDTARLFWPLGLVLICVIASVAGGFVGVIAVSLYQNRAVQDSTPAVGGLTPASTLGESVTPDATALEEPSLQDKPAEPPLESVATLEDRAHGSRGQVAEGEVEATRAARPVESDSASGTPDGNARAHLNSALESWIEATNARNIPRQMDFYSPTVNAFYLTRNVPREAVRAEKSRVFGRAELINIRAAAPDIRLNSDGSIATMRFRKKYAIEGGGEDRRGEVLQELRWRRTADGWKIISERDLRVIQ